MQGEFKVYINSTLRIEAVNNTLIKSEWINANAAESRSKIDNIVFTEFVVTETSTNDEMDKASTIDEINLIYTGLLGITTIVVLRRKLYL